MGQAVRVRLSGLGREVEIEVNGEGHSAEELAALAEEKWRAMDPGRIALGFEATQRHDSIGANSGRPMLPAGTGGPDHRPETVTGR